jgi:Uma2 family endonuclease
MATETTPPEIAPPDGDMLYEVVDGQIVEKTLGARESELAALLSAILIPFVRANRLGKAVTEMLFRIDIASKLERRPDVAFVSNERWPWNRPAPDEAAWSIVPDLAVEVVSPSNKANEVHGKVQEYFRAGVRQVWVVYPKTFQIYIYDAPNQIRVLGRDDELDGGALLPGFRLAVATLFEDEAE